MLYLILTKKDRSIVNINVFMEKSYKRTLSFIDIGESIFPFVSIGVK